MSISDQIRRQSVAIWSVLSALINLAVLAGWVSWSPEVVAAMGAVYAAGVMALRQMFSLTATGGE